MLMEKEIVDVYLMKGKSYDCGSKIGYLKVIVEFVFCREEFKDELSDFIKLFVK